MEDRAGTTLGFGLLVYPKAIFLINALLEQLQKLLSINRVKSGRLNGDLNFTDSVRRPETQLPLSNKPTKYRFFSELQLEKVRF